MKHYLKTRYLINQGITGGEIKDEEILNAIQEKEEIFEGTELYFDNGQFGVLTLRAIEVSREKTVWQIQ